MLISGAVTAMAQQTDAPAPETGIAAMVGHVSLRAEAGPDQVRVDWRPLGPGQGQPEFRLVQPSVSPKTLAVDGPEAGRTLLFAIGGNEAAIARQTRLARALGLAGMEQGGEVVLARLSPTFEVVAEVRDRDTLLAALNTLNGAIPPSGDTWRTVPDAFQYALNHPGRTALFLPGSGLPPNEEVMIGIAQAALAKEVYLFPLTSETGSAALAPFAEATGGRSIVVTQETTDPGLLGDVFGGAHLIFDLPVHRTYRLPGETGDDLVLDVQVGEASGEFVLAHEVPQIGWGGVLARMVDPRHWTGWLQTPGRQAYGAAGLVFTLLLLGGAMLGLRRVWRPRPGDLVTHAHTPSGPHTAWQSWTIGRQSDCDITLPDASVSRRHARLEETADGLVLMDEGSTNGTFLQAGEDWLPVMRSPVRPKDKVRFGNFAARVEDLLSKYATGPVGGAGGAAPTSDAALARFNKPRRNPYTGEIEEGE